MRALAVLAIPVFAARASAYEHFRSPNHRFEGYTAANLPDGTGMKLFLRRAGAHDAGRLLWQNGRWIDAKWSPDSRFLAVVDHPDGHVADVYVFGVTAARVAEPPNVALLYHTPTPFTYDVKWEVVGWHPRKREIILKQEVRDQNAHTFATHTITAKIGTEPLPYDQPNET